MEGPPPRFRCPPEFQALPGGVPMGGPQAELWLIRAPADFCPHSLEGCPVPLRGLERLRPGHTAGDSDTGATSATSATPGELLVLRAGPAGRGDCPLLLSPLSPGGALRCAPPNNGGPEHRPRPRGHGGDSGGHGGGTWGHGGGTWGHGGGTGDSGDSGGHGGGTWRHGGGTGDSGDSGTRGDSEEEEEEEAEEGGAGVTRGTCGVTCVTCVTCVTWVTIKCIPWILVVLG
ncbi:DNA-directed RNA polymerase I subunit RPA34 [Passer domesticus]|uniref:DNA-directed RNA polymerase I subunit RPA34 n=1 Tax=Passer domesticus TaxID=48849 RepID=UPI0030FE5DAA